MLSFTKYGFVFGAPLRYPFKGKATHFGGSLFGETHMAQNQSYACVGVKADTPVRSLQETTPDGPTKDRSARHWMARDFFCEPLKSCRAPTMPWRNSHAAWHSLSWTSEHGTSQKASVNGNASSNWVLEGRVALALLHRFWLA